MILGVVCARLESKGLPAKNIRPLLGVPLMDWAIQTALHAECDDVVVNTDILRKYPVERIDRPTELAGDHVSKWDVWRHTVKVYEDRTGDEVTALVDVDATRPLRTVSDVNGCIGKWRDVGGLVMATAKATKSPYFDIVEDNGSGLRLAKMSDAVARQQVPPTYYHAGVYVISRAALMGRAGIWSCDVTGYEVPEDHAWDIDTPTDWAIVEMLMRMRVERAV